MNQTGNDYIYLGLITYNQPYNSFFIGKKLFLKQGGGYINKRMFNQGIIVGVFSKYDPSNNKIIIEKISYQKPKKSFKHLRKQQKLVSEIKSFESIPFGWAMLTGSKEFISNKNISRFMETGTMHLFAVSGLHLGFFYLILSLLLKPLRINHLVVFVLKIYLCVIYLYVIEFPISAIRALIIILFFDFYNIINLKRKNINSFNVSLIAIIFFDPYVVFNLSAQMSFTVVLFILFCIPKLRYYSTIKESIKMRFFNIFIISLSASAGSSFLVLDNFGFFSFICVFTNILITPIIFVFYSINIVFFIFFIIVESCALISLHMFSYKIISFIIQLMLDFTSWLPTFHNFSYEVNDLLHFVLFSIVLILFSFSLSFKFRFFLVLIYYCLIWTVCFCLA